MNLPKDFISRTEKWLNNDYPAFESALLAESPISIRLNRAKTEAMLSSVKVPWCESGFYLKERPSFTFDPLFHAGTYYVQEASSMFLEQAIKQWVNEPKTVLDLCAAPGGKSTHLRSLLPNDCLLVSNEIIRNRSYILAENLMKWGDPNIIVTQNRADDFSNLTHFFDAIVVDAPCSGEGMFRKDPASINEWSVANVENCAIRQQDILNNIWPALRPGGILIYSTCTYNLEENENNIALFAEQFSAEVLPINLDKNWNISNQLDGDLPTYRFYPHKNEGEGFFLAVLRKPVDEHRYSHKSPKTKKKEVIKIPDIAKKWLLNADNFNFDVDQQRLYAFPKQFEKELIVIAAHCHIIHRGILLGEIKGKDIVPHQNLALSIALNQDYFHKKEIDYQTAISFLRCEALSLDDTPIGYVLLTYQNQSLGWVKNLSNRANNLYPQEWRIRSAYIPDPLKLIWEEAID